MLFALETQIFFSAYLSNLGYNYICLPIVRIYDYKIVSNKRRKKLFRFNTFHESEFYNFCMGSNLKSKSLKSLWFEAYYENEHSVSVRWIDIVELSVCIPGDCISDFNKQLKAFENMNYIVAEHPREDFRNLCFILLKSIFSPPTFIERQGTA